MLSITRTNSSKKLPMLKWRRKEFNMSGLQLMVQSPYLEAVVGEVILNRVSLTFIRSSYPPKGECWVSALRSVHPSHSAASIRLSSARGDFVR